MKKRRKNNPLIQYFQYSLSFHLKEDLHYIFFLVIFKIIHLPVNRLEQSDFFGQ